MNSVEMTSVAKELQSITVGDPTHFGGLTIFPYSEMALRRRSPAIPCLRRPSGAVRQILRSWAPAARCQSCGLRT